MDGRQSVESRSALPGRRGRHHNDSSEHDLGGSEDPGTAMRDLAEKLRGLERTLSEEKGPFNLFALFLREDAPDVWDLVVAAKWIEDDRPAALLDISKRVRAFLRQDEITKISRVVIVERTDPALKAIAA